MAVVVAVMAVIWGVSALAMAFWIDGARNPIDHQLVIPAGSAQKIADGANPLEIPSSWAFYEDDRLILINEDVVRHRLGPWLVEPGGTTTILLQPNTGGAFLCTLHPSGEIALDVQLRAFNWSLTMFPAFVVGLPLGLATLGGIRVLRALEEPNEADSERGGDT